jgi:hypothetical protein
MVTTITLKNTTLNIIMLSVFMLTVIYMLSVTIMSILPSVFMLNVVMLSVIASLSIDIYWKFRICKMATFYEKSLNVAALVISKLPDYFWYHICGTVSLPSLLAIWLGCQFVANSPT